MSGSRGYGVQERRNKRITVKKAALSSRVSLLSTITASSGGSSGSGSTITQESVSRARVRNNKTNGEHSKGKRQRAAARGAPITKDSPPENTKPPIDVFAFLANDQSRISLVEQRAQTNVTASKDGSKYTVNDESDADNGTRSLHSDSGISVNDTSSDLESSNSKNISGPTSTSLLDGEYAPVQYQSRRSERKPRPPPQHIPQVIDEEEAKWYEWEGPERSGSDLHPVATTDGEAEHVNQRDASGYDLLASKLHGQGSLEDGSFAPLYRRFGRLNHRILLQLQDEIAEMEEDLHHLDEMDAWHRTAAQQHGHMPASRRAEYHWRGSELHSRRLELLGRIYLKVEQYNQALSSFQRVGSLTSPALEEDVERYREWMSVQKPIVDAEAMYLNQSNDLVSLNQARQRTPGLSVPPTQVRALLIVMALATTTPIFVFRILPGFLSRITVILLLFVPFATFVSNGHSSLALSTGLGSAHFLSVFLGILLFAALII